jgi:hypothetical protein
MPIRTVSVIKGTGVPLRRTNVDTDQHSGGLFDTDHSDRF